MMSIVLQMIVSVFAVKAQDVLTQHNDNARSGAVLNELALNTGVVSGNPSSGPSFGKLYTRFVDGDLYAQPLYVSGVRIPGVGAKNILLVATARNNVYAFDADNYDPDHSAGLLWGPFNLGPPEIGRLDINGQPPSNGACPSAVTYGIVSTPVVDKANHWIYIVAKTIDSGGNSHQMLHRLDIRTGHGANPNATNVPTEIIYPDPKNATSVSAYGHFNPTGLNRAGLLLSNGSLYVAFSEHCDFVVGSTPHGWIMAYDAQTLIQKGGLNTTPNDQRGGIWQSGNGPAADSQGNIYFHTGNMGNLGEPSHLRDSMDLSQSIVRLQANATQPVAFPPRSEPPPWYLDYHRLDSQDLDITSSGPMLITDGKASLVGGGKPGRLYLIDPNSMLLKQTFRATLNNSGTATPETCTYGPDHYGPGTIAPTSQGETLCPHIHSGLVFWHGPEGNIARVYVWGERDYLRSYRYDTQQSLFVKADGSPFGSADDLTAINEATRGDVLMPMHDPNDGSRIMPGANLALSANGNQAGSGVLWASMVQRDNAEYKNVYGILRAFDAISLKQLWNSGTDMFSPDSPGKYAKYTAPTIANGLVYLPTFSNRLAVYGPLYRAKPFAAQWQEPEEIGAFNVTPQLVSTKTIVTPLSRDPQVLDLYFTNMQGTVMNGGWWAAGDQWHDGYPISVAGFAPPNAPVAAVSRTSQTADLYVVRNDGSVWNAGWWNQQVNGGQWNAGYSIPGAGPGFAPPGGPVSAVARTPQTADLYVVRDDGSVWNAGWWSSQVNNGQWNPGYPIPGAGPGFAKPGTRVQVVTRTPTTTDLYVVRSDGSVWNAGWWSASANNGNWNAGYPIPGAGSGFAPAGAPVTAIARTSTIVDLFVVRVDGSLWDAGWWNQQVNGGEWNAGYQIPGAGAGFARPSSRISAINRTPDSTDLFLVRPDGSIWNGGWWNAQLNKGQWNAGYRIALHTLVDPGSDASGLSRNATHTDLFIPSLNGKTLSPWWDQNVR